MNSWGRDFTSTHNSNSKNAEDYIVKLINANRTDSIC